MESIRRRGGTLNKAKFITYIYQAGRFLIAKKTYPCPRCGGSGVHGLHGNIEDFKIDGVEPAGPMCLRCAGDKVVYVSGVDRILSWMYKKLRTASVRTEGI